MEPVDSGQAGQQEADTQSDGCRGDKDAQHGFTPASKRQAQAEPNHPVTASIDSHDTVAEYHFAVRVGGNACLVGDEDYRRALLAGHRGHEVHDELSGQRVQ